MPNAVNLKNASPKSCPARIGCSEPADSPLRVNPMQSPTQGPRMWSPEQGFSQRAPMRLFLFSPHVGARVFSPDSLVTSSELAGRTSLSFFSQFSQESPVASSLQKSHTQ